MTTRIDVDAQLNAVRTKHFFENEMESLKAHSVFA